MGRTVPRRRGGDPPVRQIHEEGVLRSLDPDSESENEVVTNPCKAKGWIDPARPPACFGPRRLSGHGLAGSYTAS